MRGEAASGLAGAWGTWLGIRRNAVAPNGDATQHELIGHPVIESIVVDIARCSASPRMHKANSHTKSPTLSRPSNPHSENDYRTSRPPRPCSAELSGASLARDRIATAET